MPKNKGKGGKNRRRGKNDNEQLKRELVEKDDSQEYAQVLKMLGNDRLTAFCFDGKTRMCHIRGKMRKKIWVNTGDIILLGLRDYQDDKADVLMKYSPEEARCLKAKGHLPETTEINEDQQNGEYVEFVDNDDRTVDDELHVGVQNRDYDISSDESSDEELEEENTASSEEKENKPVKKVVKQPPAKAFVLPSSSSEENEEESSSEEKEENEESSSEEKEEEDPKLVAERGSFYKPGARDQPKKSGKRGK